MNGVILKNENNYMKLTVGGKEVIETVILQMYEGEDAWIEFKAGTWEVKINVKTIDDSNEIGKFT